MKKLVPIDIGEEQVWPAVIVVIAYSDAHPVPRSGDSGALSNIRKRSIAIVVVQAVVILGPRLHQRWHRGAVDQVDVEQSIPIVVEKRNASRHCLGLMFLWGGGVLGHEMYAGSFSDVLEPDRARRVALGKYGPT